MTSATVHCVRLTATWEGLDESCRTRWPGARASAGCSPPRSGVVDEDVDSTESLDRALPGIDERAKLRLRDLRMPTTKVTNDTLDLVGGELDLALRVSIGKLRDSTLVA